MFRGDDIGLTTRSQGFTQLTKAITFSIPEARAIRGEARQGIGLDASTDRSEETRDPGGSRARESED